MENEEKRKYLDIAYKMALIAKKKDEVPIGAIIVKDGEIIAKAYNQKEKKKCALAHAEIEAIKKASKKMKNWRLDGCEMYVTLEPCPMCKSAIEQSRISKVYFGAYKKSNSENTYYSNKIVFEECLKDERCSKILGNYFKEKR